MQIYRRLDSLDFQYENNCVFKIALKIRRVRERVRKRVRGREKNKTLHFMEQKAPNECSTNFYCINRYIPKGSMKNRELFTPKWRRNI